MSTETQTRSSADQSRDEEDGAIVLSEAVVVDDLPSPVRPGTDLQHRTEVGRRVRVRRVWVDLSQEEVAERARVSRNFVSAIERGAQGLDAWRLWALADVLGVRLEWLLTGPDDVLPGEG